MITKLITVIEREYRAIPGPILFLLVLYALVIFFSG